MALSGTVFIDRSNRTDALKAFDGAAEEIRREKQNVFIFPEGTRSYAKAPTLGAFKKGAFHLAVKAQVDVVPVVAGCYWGVLGPGERRFRAGRIPVKGGLYRHSLLCSVLLLAIFRNYLVGNGMSLLLTHERKLQSSHPFPPEVSHPPTSTSSHARPERKCSPSSSL